MKLFVVGYVVVVLDYEGLGEFGGCELYLFLNLKSEVYLIIDVVVVVSKNLGNIMEKCWIVIGYF